jgi:large subunit ribosomal protein L10
VKNTLTRRAAEAAGADALLALLEGPSAVAFLEADGDMVAAAKALADSARDTKILAIKGGVLQGRTLSAAEVEALATLPPVDVLRGQVLGAIIGPISAFAALMAAPLQNLHGLIDARIEQLEAQGDTSASGAAAPAAAEEAPEDTEEVPAEAEAPADAEASTEDTAEEAPEPAAETTEEENN